MCSITVYIMTKRLFTLWRECQDQCDTKASEIMKVPYQSHCCLFLNTTQRCLELTSLGAPQRTPRCETNIVNETLGPFSDMWHKNKIKK